MANRKAKGIVKRAFRTEGIEWDTCLDGDWEICVKYGYFNKSRNVGDFMYMVGLDRYVAGPRREEILDRWSKVALSW